MAELVLIYGRSGSGKTTSLRNFKADDLAIVNVKGKRFPFKNDFKAFVSNNYIDIDNALKGTKKKIIVIDDAIYLMQDEFMQKIGETGFKKFNDIAANFYALLETIKSLPDDVIVYVMGHSDIADDGREHFKTVGKAVDNYINVEGLCTIVLKSVGGNGVYQFQTQSNGMDTCKSPMGMFDNMLIDNDLKAVDSKIREYYGIKTEKTKEDKK